MNYILMVFIRSCNYWRLNSKNSSFSERKFHNSKIFYMVFAWTPTWKYFYTSHLFVEYMWMCVYVYFLMDNVINLIHLLLYFFVVFWYYIKLKDPIMVLFYSFIFILLFSRSVFYIIPQSLMMAKLNRNK